MTCRPVTSKHYVNQCWFIVNWTFGNKLFANWIEWRFYFKKIHLKTSSAKWLLFCPGFNELTHWGQAMHICVNKLTIIGSDNGLSPGRRQAIIWTMLEYCSLHPWEHKLQWNLNQNLSIFNRNNAFENVVWKMAAISRTHCVKKASQQKQQQIFQHVSSKSCMIEFWHRCVQHCGISFVNVLDIRQYCTKPWVRFLYWMGTQVLLST